MPSRESRENRDRVAILPPMSGRDIAKTSWGGSGGRLSCYPRENIYFSLVSSLSRVPAASTTTVNHDVVAISAARRKGRGSAAKVGKVASVLRRENIVRQENAPGIQHAGDIGHGQSLFKSVVINQHVGSDHQVEALPGREVQSLGDDVGIVDL